MSQERVSGFPEKGADLRGSPGTSGEVRGTSGEPFEKFVQTFALFPVTRVRNPTEIVQMNLFM